jgi:hypothetical protein
MIRSTKSETAPGSNMADELEPGEFPLDIKQSMKRTSDLLAVEDEVADLERLLKRRKTKLELGRKNLQFIQTVASFRHVGKASTWTTFRENEPDRAWEKEVILAILACEKNDGKLPEALQEANWCKYLIQGEHRALCRDPDVFLARFNRRDFQLYYETSLLYLVKWFNLFFILRRISNERSLVEHHIGIMATIIRKFPKVYPLVFSASTKCRQKEVAINFVRYSRLHEISMKDFWTKLGLILHPDPDIALECFDRLADAPSHYSEESSPLLSDKNFARRVADRLGHRNADVLQYFSPSIRSDKASATHFCRANARSYQYVAFALRQKEVPLAKIACLGHPENLVSFVPGKVERILLSDKKFILSLLKEIRTKSLSAPSCLFTIISPALKEDVDVIVSAFEAGIISFDCFPRDWSFDPTIRDRLKTSRLFIERAFAELSPNDDYSSLWQIALEGTRKRTRQAASAIGWGQLPLADLSCEQFCDMAFWKEALLQNPLLWSDCPFSGNSHFVRQLKSPWPLLRAIFKSFPDFSSDVLFWRRLLCQIRSARPWEFDEIWEIHKPSGAVWRDRQCMVLACALGGYNVYSSLGGALQSDERVIKAVFSHPTKLAWQEVKHVWKAKPSVIVANLGHVSDETIVEALQNFWSVWGNSDGDDDDTDIENTSHYRWTICRDLSQEILRRGLGWQNEMHPFDKEEDFMLLVAKYDEENMNQSDKSLLAEKTFILNAAEANGLVYRHVPANMCHDFDVVLTAWAKSVEVGDTFRLRGEYRFVTEFATKVRGLLRDQDIFFKTVLCGVSSHSSSPLKSIFVDSGSETATYFKRGLAEYLGIATGIVCINCERHLQT